MGCIAGPFRRGAGGILETRLGGQGGGGGHRRLQAGGRRRGARGLRHRVRDRVAAVHQRVRRRHARSQSRHDPAGVGSSRSTQGKRRNRRGRARGQPVSRPRLSLPSDHGPLLRGRPGAAPTLRSHRRSRRAGDDRCRHDRHGRRFAGWSRIEAAPRASPVHRRARRQFPESHHRRRSSRMAVGGRDDSRCAAQGQRLLGDVRMGAKISARQPQAGYPRTPARQGDVRQRLPEHAVRTHLSRVGRARLLR